MAKSAKRRDRKGAVNSTKGFRRCLVDRNNVGDGGHRSSSAALSPTPEEFGGGGRRSEGAGSSGEEMKLSFVREVSLIHSAILPLFLSVFLCT